MLAVVTEGHAYDIAVQLAIGTALSSGLFLYYGHARLFSWMPAFLQRVLSVAPLLLGFLFDWAHANQISTMQSANARVGTLVARVNSTQMASDEDMAWMQQPQY